MDSPDSTNRTTMGSFGTVTIVRHTCQKVNEQVRVEQTGEAEDRGATHLRQLLKMSLHGLRSRFSLHWSAKTSAMSTR